MIVRRRQLGFQMIVGFVACLILEVLYVTPTRAREEPALISKPVQARIEPGRFTITSATKVLYTGGDARLADAAAYLAGRLCLAFDERIAAHPSDAVDTVPGAILLTTQGADAKLGDEGYLLAVTKKGVVIRAPRAAGAFYGGISLLQLAPPAAFRAPAMVEGKLGGTATVKPARPCDEPNISTIKPVESLPVPCARIWDKPEFRWRGLLIDPARHFWTIDELKQYVDYLALHKLNSLQIHLTDHQNWCAEVNKYPRLTPEKQRNAADAELAKQETYHHLSRHYYTQEELRSLVAFAHKRFVNIVAEFEMPGHCGALMRAYPECGCTIDAAQMGGGEICPGKERTYQVLQDILDEMLEVFPGKYLHIGADECSKRYWGKCTDCQKRMRVEGLEDVTQLHGYFVNRMADYLQKNGRTLVGWDEILESGAKQGAIGMYWRSGRADKFVEMASKNGQYLVMTPTAHCYFDYVQSPDRQSEPQGLGSSVITLKRAYELQPLPDYIKQANPNLVLGAQANLWGERMKTFPHILYQTYPRGCALSEVSWSRAEGRDYADFYRRLQTHMKRLDAAGINYREPTAIDKP